MENQIKRALELEYRQRFADQLEEQEKWIPVSEGVPKLKELCLGIFKEGDTGWVNSTPFICEYVGHETKETTKDFWIIKGLTDIDNPCRYSRNLECVAWMPESYPLSKLIDGVSPYYGNVIASTKCCCDSRLVENLPSAQSKTCEGCKHFGQWENEVEYGYPSPCTRCKRVVNDNYER